MFNIRRFWWKTERAEIHKPEKTLHLKVSSFLSILVFWTARYFWPVGHRFPKNERAGSSSFIFCHLCLFPLTVFTYKTQKSNLVCFLFVLALEYPNLDISETTRDYWVITGNLLFYLFPLSPIRFFFFNCMSKGKKN